MPILMESCPLRDVWFIMIVSVQSKRSSPMMREALTADIEWLYSRYCSSAIQVAAFSLIVLYARRQNTDIQGRGNKCMLSPPVSATLFAYRVRIVVFSCTVEPGTTILYNSVISVAQNLHTILTLGPYSTQ